VPLQSTGEYRIQQAHNPVKNADNPATLRHSVFGGDAHPEPPSKEATAPLNNSGIVQAANPGNKEPGGEGHIEAKSPQRTQKEPGVEGAPYTKQPDYTSVRSFLYPSLINTHWSFVRRTTIDPRESRIEGCQRTFCIILSQVRNASQHDYSHNQCQLLFDPRYFSMDGCGVAAQHVL
jgi:hypothetical protein